MLHNRTLRVIAALLLAAGLSFGSAPSASATSSESSDSSGPLQPIDEFDIERYLGTWYQLAAKFQFFNIQCGRDTKAEYGLIDADTISVRNTCTTWWGSQSKIEGQADVVDPAVPAALRVTFPFFSLFQSPDPNYIICYIADDYSWVVLGSPDRFSGFVLSRKPVATKAEWQAIEAVLIDNGFNPDAFLTSPTTEGLQEVIPLSWAAN